MLKICPVCQINCQIRGQIWTGKGFSFEYQLNPQDLFRDLVSIEAYKEASLNLVFPQEWQHQLDRLNRVRAVHGTTAIEGNPLSEAEVAQQMEQLEQQDHDDEGKTRQRNNCRSGTPERLNPGEKTISSGRTAC